MHTHLYTYYIYISMYRTHTDADAVTHLYTYYIYISMYRTHTDADADTDTDIHLVS